MSSKEQLNDYVKRLKKEIRDLKSENKELNKQCTWLSLKLEKTERQLEESRSKERKWYHLF
jgi:predicted RNase H-like nuclease (RuvC/YqgF family)